MKNILITFSVIFLVIHVLYDIMNLTMGETYDPLKPYYLGLLGTFLVLVFQYFDKRSKKKL